MLIKRIVVKSLISEWHLDLHLILKILEIAFGNNEQCSFQIFYDGNTERFTSLNLNDRDTVAAMIQRNPIKMTLSYTEVREPNEIYLKYDLKSKQFVDVLFSNNLQMF